MVLYSFGDQGNWIIVAGIYHAANLENNPAALCKSMCDNRFCETINSESRITIVAHGDKGIINGCNANEVLQYLEDNKGRVCPRSELLKQVWKYDFLGDERTVDVTIKRTRQKIEPDQKNFKYILTRRGFGYFFPKDLT